MIRLSRPTRKNTAMILAMMMGATVALCIMASPNVAAMQYESYLQRKQNLVALSGIFGQLHHIRRTCDPRLEANIWRQRMQTMIELEEPDEATHLDMVNAFNDGFQAMRAQYPECTRAAQDKGKDLAFQGSAIVQSLASDLEPTSPVTNTTPR